MAFEMLKAMPQRALHIIRGGNFTGANLVKLESDICRPSFRDWCQHWLYAVVCLGRLTGIILCSNLNEGDAIIVKHVVVVCLYNGCQA